MYGEQIRQAVTPPHGQDLVDAYVPLLERREVHWRGKSSQTRTTSAPTNAVNCSRIAWTVAHFKQQNPLTATL